MNETNVNNNNQSNEEVEEINDEFKLYYDGLQESKHMKYYTNSFKSYENKQHKRVSSTLVPLKSEDLQSIRINTIHILAWKLNLMAVSYNSKFIFTAESDVINVRNIDNPNIIIKTFAMDTMEMTINQIRLGILDGEEVLVSVDEGGFVRIIFVNDFEREVIRLYNHGVSTWGIAICPSKPLIAVSSNSHKITIWNLDDENPQETKFLLPKHKHNIPSIDFSPCGNYLVSVSIDKNIRIWDVNKRQLLRIQTLAQWCWACRWIDLTTKEDQLYQYYNNSSNSRDNNNNNSNSNNNGGGGIIIDKSWRGLTQHEEQQLVENNQEVEPMPEEEEEEEEEEVNQVDNDDEIFQENDDNEENEENTEFLNEANDGVDDDDDLIIQNGVFTNEDDIIFDGGLPPINQHQQQQQQNQEIEEEGQEGQEEQEDGTENENNQGTIATTTTTTTTIINSIKKLEDAINQQRIENNRINSKVPLDKNKLPSNVVFSTYQNLYLSDVEMDLLLTMNNAIPTSFPIIQTQIDRIAFLEVVPELSLVIAASQGPARLISLYRIVKQIPLNNNINNNENNNNENNDNNLNEPETNMFLESVLSPPSGGPGLIVGLSVVKNYVKNNPLAFSINLYVMYINGIFINFHIKRSTIRNKPIHQNSTFFDPINKCNIFGLDITSFGV
ncbi:hypothetical protein ACTFIT_007386 [Dictyostelium discoideum]|uniref:WD40 repeat-containing protein DDB_G0271002 n=2 Tax=Dictyostelium discoideum TaxID=44689 RepID=W1002_DICDI|nr:RecName: Full=WD40 repeat-containing protein DDB_G0271002 [Dictyostelium discoideum]